MYVSRTDVASSQGPASMTSDFPNGLQDDGPTVGVQEIWLLPHVGAFGALSFVVWRKVRIAEAVMCAIYGTNFAPV